ncbi:MAG: SH3 domain-containing protein [Candidatus Flexifilum sp.]
MTLRSHFPLILLLLAIALAAPLLAQDTGGGENVQPTLPAPTFSAGQCAPALFAIWAAATEACVGAPAGYICNGGAAPQVEPAGAVAGAVAAFGSLVDAASVDALRTPRIAAELGTAGLIWIRPAPPLTYTALLFGDVSARDVSPPDFPAWTSTVLITRDDVPTCEAAPLSAAIYQSPVGAPNRIVINGVSVYLNGTILIHTDLGAESGSPPATTTFVALSGVSSLLAGGTEVPLLTGQEIALPYAFNDFSRPLTPPPAAVPFNPVMLQNLPVALLDRPVVLPQPGNVATQGEVNLRSAPSTDAGVITRVPGGEILAVLGRSTDGAWFHVRRDNGETGWMLAELLAQNLGPIAAAYDATPLPPQRYGQDSATARVIAPAGVNLRAGPDPSYGVVAPLFQGTVVTLIARSPYGPWVKVDSAGTQGWVALVALETRAYLEALPIDPSAPPPPPPTRVPGSFGNAFPDPNAPEGGN